MIHLDPDPASGIAGGATGEIRFVHAYRASAVLGALAVAGAIAAWTLMSDGVPRLIFTFGPAVLGLRFLGASLRRYELVIDPEARRWRRRSGPYFALRSVAGSLDDLAGVVLTLQHTRTGSGSSSRNIPVWTITLEFAGPDWDGTPLLIDMVESDEAAAYRRLEEFARRLRTDAIDRTALDEARRAWEAVDEPGLQPDLPPDSVARTGDPVFPRVAPRASPPSRTGIRVTIQDGRWRITLPPHGVGFGTVVGVLIGLLLATLGGFFALEPLRALGVPGFDGSVTPATPGEVGVTLAVAGVFVVMGIKAVSAAVQRARSREWVLDLPDHLRFGTSRGRRISSWTELPKAAIEEVALRTPQEGGARLHVLGIRVPIRPRDPAEAALVRVRTDDALVRIGRRLSPEGKAWLRDTLAAAARAGTGTRP